ncbi:hypothetical protein L873DRAFT_1788443 [Choiromyces venosus 120613-1]|uniref:Uncharacterized protein n=1 Tax=Choiromyces venosus 120613-1 TaxID=1336337 RepID=A0A3N4JS22_9PEZI|nr:hypothetical protein L873DRAFT_1788443 [Choiromyces venosus 120613-1]
MQLFYKHKDGTIRHQDNNGSKWGKQSAAIITPKNDSGLAAIGWVPTTGVRVYTVSDDNILMETAWNSTAQVWNTYPIPGELDPPIAGSHLTAYTWLSGTRVNIRLYYQGEDGYIREGAYTTGSNASNAWTRGAAPSIQDFPRARNGTGLAVVTFPFTSELEAKLYYQSTEGKLMSYDYRPAGSFDESWQRASVDHGVVPDRAQITAVINRSANLTLRVYFTQDDKLQEIFWKPKGGWRKASTLIAAAARGVATISYTDDVKVFFQYRTEYLSTGLKPDSK